MKKLMKLALGTIGAAAAALAIREAIQREKDKQLLENGREYWKIALPRDDVRWIEEHITTYHIPSGDVGVHVDLFAQNAVNAPTVIVVHGLSSYGKLMIPAIRRWFDRGYTVVAMDLPGNGLSGGYRGDFPVPQAVQSIIHTASWARNRFDGPIYLMGLSLGGGLAYSAAAAGAPVSAVSCLDLFLFNDIDSLKKILPNPDVLNALPVARAASLLFGWVRIPSRWFFTIENVVSEEERPLVEPWLTDPLSPKELSLRTLVSAVCTEPARPLRENTIPIIIFNQTHDRVLDPSVTRHNFELLNGEKRYIELQGSEHWSFKSDMWDTIIQESDTWFQEHRTRTAKIGFGTAKS